jgi:hypothetical protein
MMTIRRIAGSSAAVAMTPYLLIKVAWTFGILVPTEEMNSASWRAVNATTAVLAAAGILLALALSRPWGERLPGWLIALPVWVGTGLLIPMVFLAPVLGPAAIVRDRQANSADVWVYEQVFVMLSLVGVGVGLPIALAGYARARWPEALSGPLSVAPPGSTRRPPTTLAWLVAAGCIALGAVKVYWAAGGSVGIQPDRLNGDMWWHLLSLSTGAWALVGAWGLLALATGRGSRRFALPMAAVWVSSGMLFAYNLFFAVRFDSALSPEHPLARNVTTGAGIILGVLMGLVILLVLHDRREARRTGLPRWVTAPDRPGSTGGGVRVSR